MNLPNQFYKYFHTISLYSLIGDFGKSQNKCKWFNIWSNFLLWWHIFVPNWLVPSMWISLLSHIEYICVFLVIYLKTVSLSSLKIMKKFPITEYSDPCGFCIMNFSTSCLLVSHSLSSRCPLVLICFVFTWKSLASTSIFLWSFIIIHQS